MSSIFVAINLKLLRFCRTWQIFLVSISVMFSKMILLFQIKLGFHITASVANIAAVVEKRVSATVAIYGNTLFNDSSDGSDRKISISATVATVYFVNGNQLKFQQRRQRQKCFPDCNAHCKHPVGKLVTPRTYFKMHSLEK